MALLQHHDDPGQRIPLPPASTPHRLGLLSTVRPGMPLLATRLAIAGLQVSADARWGDVTALAALHSHSPAALLLDLSEAQEEAVPDLIRAARLIAPTIALPPTPRCALAAFEAGAIDVLDHRARSVELAWRIHACLRRITTAAKASHHFSGSLVQSMLFDILINARQPVCCHQLRLLLGSPDLPMTMRALKARIHRLHPALHEQQRSLVMDQQWGLVTYACQPPSAPRSVSWLDAQRGSSPA
ncbi:hypothetical protein [Streptomyces sp. NPDC005533]|uniref:hypothetical protein n=1 Tax=Streptomyces sp. NPDC005533 TaxID=3364723 RepID=UPI0036C3C91E